MNWSYISAESWAEFTENHKSAYSFLLHASLCGEHEHLRHKQNAAIEGLNPYETKRLAELDQWAEVIAGEHDEPDDDERDKPDIDPRDIQDMRDDERCHAMRDGDIDKDGRLIDYDENGRRKR